ncbi:diacylglycerol/polyprenol kinase family protein [Pseudanabaena sp. PCC 6802]|uniref:diacylglycerol/polyprenol kinase family protein n=1 Tax=Pseudanabaena sp. PCC 6802 TaxID=118173 RepID=UPI000348D252|nr:diacylglycerol/polyprenol kinase family protein [Pseudanabaena sp. PCC 6802]
MFAIAEPIPLWLQITAVGLWLGFVFLTSTIMRRLGHEPELVRKVVHIGTGNVLFLAWGLNIPLWLCFGASVTFTAIALLSYFLPVLPMLDDVGRKTHGVFYYAVSITCLVTWFWSIGLPQYAVVGIIVMAWGDGLAALVGQRWGQHAYHFMGNKRTLEGSLAMLVTSYAATCLILGIAQGINLETFLIPLPVAAVAAVLESVSPGGTDNLTVPLTSASLCYGLSLIG